MKRSLLGILLCLIVSGIPLTAVCSQEASALGLSSPSFNKGEAIPEEFSCHGKDVNPPLNILNVPSGAKSLALIVDDPDAPEGTWVHWVIYNIPPDTAAIKENSKVGVEGLTDFASFQYHGPCPANKKPHHYSFRLYALKEKLDLNEGFIKSDLEAAMKGKIIEQAELIGTYKNPDKYNE